MLGENTMKKITIIISICLVFALTFSGQLSAFALSNSASEVSTSIDVSDITLSPEADATFNKDVANDDVFIELVTSATIHRKKNVSLNDVHGGKSIKLYGIKNSENILQSLYDSYIATGTMQSMIDPDYGILKLYVNGNNEFVDSLAFTREGNLPGAKAKNGWIEVGSGSATSKDDPIVKYSQDENLKNFITSLGIENAENLKLISSIPSTGMRGSIYFVQNNEEFLIPLEDVSNCIKALQVYKVSDIFQNYLKPILDFEKENAKKYANVDPKDVPDGPLFPSNFPTITAIDMHTYGTDNLLVAEQTPMSTDNNNSDSWYLFIFLSTAAILIISGIVIVVKKNKKVSS